ncbi:hypothetical protein FQZ97_354880 [compost metagenome]
MARGNQRATAQPAAKPEKKTSKGGEPNLLQGIFVRSFPEIFRRAGHTFTREGHGLLLRDLTEAQLAAIVAEPMLRIERAEFPATEADDELLQRQAGDEDSPPPPPDGIGSGVKDPANSGGNPPPQE